ncbi:hypothetical protein [Ensifer adhaerens]|uniref:hypothetical protein n=1 Tax=Ensifer adhaerens TaxID=106592 RepID=UPI00131A2872|nr:hypothetical protein [Ensifer adhaerens]
MKIKHAKPVRQEPSPGGFRTLARFAIEPAPGVLIFDCSLVRAPDGRVLFYGPPSRSGAQILSLAPEVRREIIQLTTDEVGINVEQRSAA